MPAKAIGRSRRADSILHSKRRNCRTYLLVRLCGLSTLPGPVLYTYVPMSMSMCVCFGPRRNTLMADLRGRLPTNALEQMG